jgi:hypothetical protein
MNEQEIDGQEGDDDKRDQPEFRIWHSSGGQPARDRERYDQQEGTSGEEYRPSTLGYGNSVASVEKVHDRALAGAIVH